MLWVGNMKMRWTDREINLIRAGFIAGKPIKIISREVGRSPTAVNKFLSRAGIRKRRWTISKPKRYFESDKPLPNPKPIVDQSQKYEIISDLNDVIQFLSANGLFPRTTKRHSLR